MLRRRRGAARAGARAEWRGVGGAGGLAPAGLAAARPGRPPAPPPSRPFSNQDALVAVFISNCGAKNDREHVLKELIQVGVQRLVGCCFGTGGVLVCGAGLVLFLQLLCTVSGLSTRSRS